jgi:hypothetical protein
MRVETGQYRICNVVRGWRRKSPRPNGQGLCGTRLCRLLIGGISSQERALQKSLRHSFPCVCIRLLTWSRQGIKAMGASRARRRICKKLDVEICHGFRRRICKNMRGWNRGVGPRIDRWFGSVPGNELLVIRGWLWWRSWMANWSLIAFENWSRSVAHTFVSHAN